MTNITCVDENYSTTRLLTRENPVIENKLEDKFESVLFLPEGEGRQGEGGLRTQGYFKTSHADKPLITVVTVVFNGEKFLEETIQSVINQTYDNVEYIIIDGGSTDGTLDIIRQYEHAIDYWVSERDRGISDAFNKGIYCSLGEVIGLINADDYYFVDALENISKVLLSNKSRNKNFVLHGKTKKITLDGKIKDKNDNKTSWCLCVPFSHCSSFISKSAYKQLGVYDLTFKIAMDVDLLFRCREKADFFDTNVYIATQRDGGVSDQFRVKGYREYISAAKGRCNIVKLCFYFTVKVLVIYLNRLKNV